MFETVNGYFLAKRESKRLSSTARRQVGMMEWQVGTVERHEAIDATSEAMTKRVAADYSSSELQQIELWVSRQYDHRGGR